MKTKVLITGALHESALKQFMSTTGFDCKYLPDCSKDELFANLASTQVLVTRSETDVDRKVLDAAPNLRIVARAAVGVGNIDLDYATERGVLVINCPGKNTNSAAELTLGLMLAVFRKIPAANAHLKSGAWDRHRFSGFELRGKRIGIVGLGNVGHRVAKFALGFDMKVTCYDPYLSPEVFLRYGVGRADSLVELARESDILTVHVPLNSETRQMINRQVIDAMPANSYIINAARGGVCAEADLVQGLNSGKLAGVGLDTFEGEPKPSKDLTENPRVVCTPHIGASTEEAQISIGNTIYEQTIKALGGGVVDYPVNLPNIGIPETPLVKSYAVLAEKLGSLLGQLLDFNPAKFEIYYRGDLASLDHKFVRLSLLKGFVSHVVDDYVSLVNTQSHFEKLGIIIDEKSDPAFTGYKSALKVIAYGLADKKLSVGGIVFDSTMPRISLLKDFHFEIDPVGKFLLMENHDRPGVIGDVGHYLASQNINIDNFSLSRNRQGDTAMAVIRTDSSVSQEQLEKMSIIKNVIRVSLVNL